MLQGGQYASLGIPEAYIDLTQNNEGDQGLMSPDSGTF
jgi:hypothetical protein